jgi:hypothetical protein
MLSSIAYAYSVWTSVLRTIAEYRYEHCPSKPKLTKVGGFSDLDLEFHSDLDSFVSRLPEISVFGTGRSGRQGKKMTRLVRKFPTNAWILHGRGIRIQHVLDRH